MSKQMFILPHGPHGLMLPHGPHRRKLKKRKPQKGKGIADLILPLIKFVGPLAAGELLKFGFSSALKGKKKKGKGLRLAGQRGGRQVGRGGHKKPGRPRKRKPGMRKPRRSPAVISPALMKALLS